jgi:Zn-dependent protease with chaperone function
MRRLNPFALPVETDARFTLLIIAVPAALLALAHGVLPLFYAGEAEGSTYVQLIDNSLTRVGCTPETLEGCDPAAGLVAIGYLALVLTVCPGGLLAAGAILAVWRFWGHPQRVIARHQARPADPRRDRSLFNAMQEVSRQAGLSRLPRLVIGRPNTFDGQAFGTSQQPQIRLGGGLRLLRVKAPDHFRAIALHELGHIANGDLDRAYWAEAFWQAMLPLAAVALVGTLGANLLRGLANELTILAPVFALLATAVIVIEATVLLGVIALIWRSVLRVREYYADAFADQLGSGPALRALLTVAAQRTPSRPGWHWHLHPTIAERLNALEAPQHLFRLSRDVIVPAAFLLGMIAAQGANLVDLATLASILLNDPDLPLIDGLGLLATIGQPVIACVTGLLCAGLLAHSVGLQVVRQALVSLVEPHHPHAVLGLARAAAWAVLGFESALWILPFDPLTASPGRALVALRQATDVGPLLAELALGLVLQAVWMIALWGVLLVCFLFLDRLARRLLVHRIGLRPPWAAIRRLLHASAVSWCPLLIAAVVFRYGLNERLAIGPAAVVIGLLGLLAGLVAAVVTGLVFALPRASRHCPQCGAPTNGPRALNSTCAACGRPQAAWAFQP